MENIVSLERKPTIAEVLRETGIILIVTVVCGAMISVIGAFVVSLGMGLKPEALNLTAKSPENIILANKIIQLISSFGIFLAPALILPMLLYKSGPARYFGLKHQAPLMQFLLALLAFFTLMPLLEWTIHINQGMTFPSFLKGLETQIKGMEDSMKEITEVFMKMPSTGSFIFTVICMAVVPAIAEEFFFRGFLQTTIFRWTKKIHFSIILTGFIFSFIHFQFYGFLPRMLLGIFLGYIFYWTGDLKASIFIHFTNNFLSVLVFYISQNKHVDIDPDNVSISPALVLLSIILGSAIMYLLYKTGTKRNIPQTEELEVYASEFPSTGRWVKVYSSPRIMEAEIILGKLHNEELNAVLKNKKDSAYTVFGTVEIYVPEAEEARAKIIIGMDNNINAN